MTAAVNPLYLAPRSLEEVLQELAEPRTAAIGGGSVLLPAINQGRSAAARVVDLAQLATARTLERRGSTLSVGPMVTYNDLLISGPERSHPLLRKVAATITGGPQLRRQGTWGGSACYANPASDAPTALVALGAVMIIDSVRGRRRLSAGEFFRGPFTTALRPDELLSGIELPADVERQIWAYEKLKTCESSWPIANAVACVRPDIDGPGAEVLLTLGACTPAAVTLAPVILSNTRSIGAPERDAICDRVAAAVEHWFSDALAEATYRRRVAPVIAVRALERALCEHHT